MSGLAAALWTETLKFRRSKAPWLSALGFSLAPLVGGLFMVILKDPQLARRMGLLATKAEITTGVADWPTYFGLLAQATAVGGAFLFGLIFIWVFGREYSDRTAKDLLALPTARGAIVLAKFIVAGCWSAGLVVWIYVLGLGIGSAIVLPGGSVGLALSAAGTIALVAGLTLLLTTPVALAASAGRGYLSPIGFLLLAAFLSQVLAVLGWGPYFPWSVPALASGAAGAGAQVLGAGSYLLVVFTGIAGLVGTLAWWQFADQT
jgi:ABC-2 type transport system permease protein